MKKFKVWLFSFLGVVSVAGILFSASNDFTDFWTIKGRESLNNTAIAFIDSSRDFNLYDGDIFQGLNGSRPSTSSGAYPGQMFPFYNASGGTLAVGDVLIASGTSSTSGYATTQAVASTTTIIGVCAGTVANGAVGWMVRDGYALVKATGAVNMGDLLMTSGATAGNAVSTTGVTLDGIILGKAMSTQTAASPGSILAIIDLQ